MSAVRSVSMALVAKNSDSPALTVSRSMRVRPMMASTCGASACGDALRQDLEQLLDRLGGELAAAENAGQSAPRKMQNGNSETTNENATAPAMAKPLCS